MTRWLSALGVLAAGVALLAAEDKESTGAKRPADVSVISLTIRKAPPPKPGTYRQCPNGIDMEVRISLPEQCITGVDVESAKLDRFTDDKGHVLFHKDSGLGAAWLPDYGMQFGPNGELVTVPVRGTNPPAKGAAKIILKGSLNVKCGSDAKATPVKVMALKPKQEVPLGPFTVRVRDSSGEIQVLSDEENIKNVEFFDAKGKPIVVTGPPGRKRISSGKGKWRYVYSYYLSGKKEKFSIKIHYFPKIKIVKVPLDLRVGLSLD